MIKILSWNINGLRSALSNGFLDEIWKAEYDILCLQEVKLADCESLKELLPTQYHIYANIVKNAKNGVLVLAKEKAKRVSYVIGHDHFDKEGRFIAIDFSDFSLINLYMPHGGRDKSKLNYKLEVAKILEAKLKMVSNQKIIISTDFNIAREDIDVCRASQNRNNIMFTDTERVVVNNLLKVGYKDMFRELYPEKVEYTWWSYAFECRKRNIGWRIDYFFVSEKMSKQVTRIDVLKEQLGSDHCPMVLEVREERQPNERRHMGIY